MPFIKPVYADGLGPRPEVFWVKSEPIRDWSKGFFTGHRIWVMGTLIIGMAALYALQAWFWPTAHEPQNLLEIVWSWGSLLWIGAVIPGAMGLAGLLAYRHPKKLDHIKPIDKLVSLRIVS